MALSNKFRSSMAVGLPLAYLLKYIIDLFPYQFCFRFSTVFLNCYIMLYYV